MRCVKSHAGNPPLLCLLRTIFSVADHGMSARRKLHPDLVLQSRYQRDADKRSCAQQTFNRIPEFSARTPRVVCRGQLLKHSYPTKVVDERSFTGAQMSADHRKILPHRSVAEKLLHQRVAVPLSLGKEHNSGGEAIDAVYDKCLLPLPFQFAGKKRPDGRRVGAFHRHCGKAGRLINRHNRVVFIKHGKIP